jgi:hypothetical protein
VSFQKRYSQEMTAAHLDQQIKWIGPGNRFTPIYQGLRKELAQDPSLRIYSVFLGTGSGDKATQDVFTVKLRVDKGQVKSEVKRDDL